MLKKTITYTDYDGNERKEDFYFNLTKAELTEMELTAEGGMEKRINKIVQTKDGEQLVQIFKDIILRSYGEKSLDGKRFIKNKELVDSFAQTEAYSNLFMELATNTESAIEFVNGIMPNDVRQKITQVDVDKKLEENNLTIVNNNAENNNS